MISFDKSLWWNRAWERHRRAVAKDNVDVAVATEKWTKDALSIQYLEKLVEWCSKKGIAVVFAKKEAAVYDQNTKTVTVSGRLSPEKQIYVLLHECGHFLVGDNPRFGKGYPQAFDPKLNASFEHRLACLEEEIEAWNRGWKLAKRLGLRLDHAAFEKTRAICLKSYVNWVSKK